MKISNEFTVHAPIERAWALLTDVEAIAPCMPGAQLTGIRPADPDETPAGEVAAEVYEGKVKVKMGPVVAEYKGTASFVEKDDAAYRGVIDAKGRDSRGAGNASALITVQLRPEGDGTTVGIDTELKISGKIAQFGAGMIQEVSEKLLGQFVGCLEGKLAAPAESTAADPTTAAADPTATAAAAPKAGTGAGAAAEPTATAASTATAEPPATAASTAAAEPAPAAEPAATAEPPTIEPLTIEPSTIAPATAPPAAPTAAARRTFQASAEPEALDLLELAGGSAFKRLLPVLIAGLAAVAVVIIFRTRR